MLAIGVSPASGGGPRLSSQECLHRLIVGARRVEIRQVPGARQHDALRERQRARERLARAAADRRVEFAVHDEHRLREARERGGARRRRRRMRPAPAGRAPGSARASRATSSRAAASLRVQPHQRMGAPGAPECLDALLARPAGGTPRSRNPRRRPTAGSPISSGGPSSTSAGDALRLAQRERERDARALRMADERRARRARR